MLTPSSFHTQRILILCGPGVGLHANVIGNVPVPNAVPIVVGVAPIFSVVEKTPSSL